MTTPNTPIEDELYKILSSRGIMNREDRLAVIPALLAWRDKAVAEAEKALIIWALQAETHVEPRFISEPLATAHRLVERMKELDPDFAARLTTPTKEGS